MNPADHAAEQRDAAEVRRELDGLARVPLLPLARVVISAPSADPDEPAAVIIEWRQGVVERATPGSAIWRAALQRQLAEPARNDPADAIVRGQMQRSLARFPDMESWFALVRTGWLVAPTAPPARPPRRRWWPW